MPLLSNSYTPPFLLRNAHLNTIIPNSIRKISEVQYKRERVELPDGDFVDLDFSGINSKRLVILLHGLEGNSKRAYAKSIIREANKSGFDACVFNQRGCSGEANRLLISYHSGKTDDLELVLTWLLNNKSYESIHIVGISLGGNITLKYLGEKGTAIPEQVKSAVAISVPIDLHGSAIEMAKFKNWIYLRRLLSSLKAKALAKTTQFPKCEFSRSDILACRNFVEYDDLYTAPVHGFINATDYYTQCSSKQFIPFIKLPTLLISALDDPFINENCYPFEEAKVNDAFYLLTPKYGGHVGFVESFPLSKTQWVEKVAMDFIMNGI